MSLSKGQPPAEVPGYDLDHCLGAGAYGEVWIAVERNTGRRVAIKFYAHRGGLDWSLLSREVEKLAFLFADRYVVQLLGVGWDAEPPYYIMEYLENGSLADRLQHGPLPAEEAVAVLRDTATGLVHAHGKGVLHCDLKPANVLLDQDNKPRLADFGQSRLSHEQLPALGTLFYMAPEQADLEAVPEARWDVYALGALLYCMLTGKPPHRTGEAAREFENTPNLLRRLSRYRKLIEQSPLPSEHRKVPGVDRSLADIVDRCLAPDPHNRYPNVQAVLDALDLRAKRQARRPMMILGAIGPALLVLVVVLIAWKSFGGTLQQSREALMQKALDTNDFAADYVVRAASTELERRWAAVQQVARSPELRSALAAMESDEQMTELLGKLADPNVDPAEQSRLRSQFHAQPLLHTLEEEFAAAIPENMEAGEGKEVASWFVCGPLGNSLVRLPEPDPARRTTGKNFAWRSFFHGGPDDQKEHWRPPKGQHVNTTTLSAVFPSQATKQWIVAVSTPVFDSSPQRKFLGVVALTIEVGRLVELQGEADMFATLVDYREGKNKGIILQHPLINRLVKEHGKLPDWFTTCRVNDDDLPNTQARREHYADPLAAAPEGEETYNRHWLAQMREVKIHDEPTGCIMIVQQDYNTAIGATLDSLRFELVRHGLVALALVAVLMVALWTFAIRLGVRY